MVTYFVAKMPLAKITENSDMSENFVQSITVLPLVVKIKDLVGMSINICNYL